MRPLFMLLLLLLAARLMAADKAPTGAPHSEDDWKTLRCLVDKDNNGKLSLKELDAYKPVPVRRLAQDFAAIDTDKDGSISPAEFAAYLKQGRSAWEKQFKGLDSDKNGGLSQAELAKTKPGEYTLIKRHFNDIDSNHDGVVSMPERDAFIEKTNQDRAEKRAAMRAKRAASKTR